MPTRNLPKNIEVENNKEIKAYENPVFMAHGYDETDTKVWKKTQSVRKKKQDEKWKSREWVTYLYNHIIDKICIGAATRNDLLAYLTIHV